jgi:glycogen phosphorylase
MDRTIAYFSMEIALHPQIPTYSGGLGVLAGDTLRSAADLELPVIGISLLHRSGYFSQRLDECGRQTEEPVNWRVEDFLTEAPARSCVRIEGRTVLLRAWVYEVQGTTGHTIPVYLLDSDLPENYQWDRTLTHFLYGGDSRYRLCQEIILGMGGVRLLRELGYHQIDRFHMNEGHASFLTLQLLQEHAGKAGRDLIEREDLGAVREKCIFTTHTPVPAGHDQFPLELVCRVLGYRQDLSDVFTEGNAARVFGQKQNGGEPKILPEDDPAVNMTCLGLNMSRYVNGVAKKHGEVTRLMFAGYQIDAITNGVHAVTWSAAPFQSLFDRYIPDWREDNFSLRHAESIPRRDVWDAHMEAKNELLDCLNRKHAIRMNPDVLTIGFARRATAYKRADLLFTDLERLRKIVREVGGLQIIYAGKAHPRDTDGKALIQRIFEVKKALQGEISIAFVENYDMTIAKLMTSGVDLWLNTPRPPLEASGTSGMKAALNGIPSLSIVDGWWVEGLIEGVTGWSIGGRRRATGDCSSEADAMALYEKLEEKIIPTFYKDQNSFIDVMRHTIALNGAFFNTQRMLQQYVLSAYFH